MKAFNVWMNVQIYANDCFWISGNEKDFVVVIQNLKALLSSVAFLIHLYSSYWTWTCIQPLTPRSNYLFPPFSSPNTIPNSSQQPNAEADREVAAGVGGMMVQSSGDNRENVFSPLHPQEHGTFPFWKQMEVGKVGSRYLQKVPISTILMRGNQFQYSQVQHFKC
jgi:hypothetical protein